jgi:hypothetical protein
MHSDRYPPASALFLGANGAPKPGRQPCPKTARSFLFDKFPPVAAFSPVAPRKLPSCGLRDGSGVAGCPRRSRRPARERRTRLGSQRYGPSDRPRVPDGSPGT